ncbi:MAG: HD domain-containing protein [Gemmatimonadetes bacterium]|nr:HD domain-containing protein [Gemmatimonadota bacterium]
MNAPAFLSAIAIERDRRMAGREAPDAHARVLWDRALATVGTTERAALQSACDYAMGIPYRHEGLSSEIYSAHPLRVASFAVLSQVAPAVEAGVVGLLHNVLEVSDVPAAELEQRFGDSVRRQVESLTVERAQQWDADYKRNYYAVLDAGPIAARIVKVFDKLDNLYLLGVNPDRETKRRYAEEIRNAVLPMARRDMPAVGAYLAALLSDTIASERLELPAA